jgi:hypothetical protein
MSYTRRPTPTDDLPGVDATIRWLVAYRALATDQRRCLMGAGQQLGQHPPALYGRRTDDRVSLSRLVVAAGVVLMIVGVAQRVV